MKLVWHDEFDGVADTDGQLYIDRTKWQTHFWQGDSQRTLAGNGEAELYLDKDYGGTRNLTVDRRPNPFSFEQPGILTISAFRTPAESADSYGANEQRPFTSGLLISDQRFTTQYGYIEGRFKIPMERGAWPAFWLLADDMAVGDPSAALRGADGNPTPDENKAHPWPPEVDILESLGIWKSKFDTGYIAPKGEKVKVSQWMHDTGANLGADFHTWGYEWDENNMVWTMDGKIIAHGNVTQSFRRSFYILINLGVGGSWYAQITKGKPWEVDETTMPWKMLCDYVRVYQAAPGTPPSAPLQQAPKGPAKGSLDPQAQ